MERKTVRYTGRTPDEAQGCYNSDATAAQAAGWVVEVVDWEASAPEPTLVVSYIPAPPPMPPAPSDLPPEERPYATTSCPTCAVALDPLPKAKKKCPACAASIYVRRGPDGVRHLLAEGDLAAHDAKWAAYDEQVAQAEAAHHNLEAAQSGQRQLADYAQYDADGVELLVMDDACPACAVHRHRRYRLADAPTLPIRGCAHDICRCDYAPLAFGLWEGDRYLTLDELRRMGRMPG